HADHAGRAHGHLLRRELEQPARLRGGRLRVLDPAPAGRRVGDAGVDHDRLRLRRLDVLAIDEQTGRLHLVAAEHCAADGRLARAHDRQVEALAPDPGGDGARGKALRSRDAHTNTPAWRRPAVSSQPNARLAFWIAWPAAPLPRLSSAPITTA